MATKDTHFRRFWASAITALVLLPAGLLVSTGAVPLAGSALAADNSEAEAFESAKALGTVEAWDAFLSHYPTGFRADLARAYVKQLANRPAPAPLAAPPPAAPAVAVPEQAAYEQTCAGQQDLRSRESREPAKLRFVNASGATLVLQWIDFNGALKEYATLPPGADLTQDTYLTHPWIVAYQEGSCRQIFLPAPGTSVAYLRPQMESPRPAAPVRAASPRYEPEPLRCGKNYKKVGGKCVLIQNCGANAYRSPEGDCYCKKNYEMHNGKCRWKQNKNGFEVAPWKKPGCKTWERQCAQGNANACMQYEATCQVN